EGGQCLTERFRVDARGPDKCGQAYLEDIANPLHNALLEAAELLGNLIDQVGQAFNQRRRRDSTDGHVVGGKASWLEEAILMQRSFDFGRPTDLPAFELAPEGRWQGLVGLNALEEAHLEVFVGVSLRGAYHRDPVCFLVGPPLGGLVLPQLEGQVPQ